MQKNELLQSFYRWGSIGSVICQEWCADIHYPAGDKYEQN